MRRVVRAGAASEAGAWQRIDCGRAAGDERVQRKCAVLPGRKEGTERRSGA